MTGEISYVEIGSDDAQATTRFVSELFGWPLHHMGDGGDGWFEGDGFRAGFHGNDPEYGTVIYFRVSDLDAAVARVSDLGGEVEHPIADEPGFGRFATCRDPRGVRFGLHAPE